MLSVEVEFLAGRYTATRFNDRARAEWPPHPARLFSALVAGWADGDSPDEAERMALLWLEALGAPLLACGEADLRTVVTHYVPVNDTSVVRSQDAVYAKLAEADRAVRVAAGGADDATAAQLAAVSRTLDRLRAKAVIDSRRATAAGGDSAAARAAALELLPERRGKQGRTYPTVIPADDRCWFVWPDADGAAGHVPVLDGLLARVSRLGHSSSQVACRVAEDHGTVTWVPDADGEESLRVMAPGLLDRLVDEFSRHQGNEPRTLPSATASYRRFGSEAPPKRLPPLLGGEWFVLGRRDGATPPVTAALAVAEAVRGALLSNAGDPSPEILSGHLPGGVGERTAPTDRPHLAVVPLPYVGTEYADGSLLGVALVLPTETSRADRTQLLRALGGWREADGSYPLRLGGAGLVNLELLPRDQPKVTLQRSTWCRSSRRWVSVTPIALDHFPGRLNHADPARRARAEQRAVDAVTDACRWAGLPEPVGVEIEMGSPAIEVPPIRRFPSYRRAGGRVTRPTVHVRLDFETEVSGPVLIGAGRYLGYGLCRPVRTGDGDRA